MFTFQAQSQPRLATVAFRLEAQDVGEWETVALLPMPEGLILQFSDDVPPVTVPLPAPARQQPAQRIPLQPRRRYEATIAAEPRVQVLDVVEPPITAGELNARSVRSARCRVCGRAVWGVGASADPSTEDDHPAKRQRQRRATSRAAKSKGYVFRALPSSHWHESSEAWLCHPSGEFTGKLQRWVERGWWPGGGVGLVAERWVAVRGVVGEEMESSLTTWLPMHCPAPACNATVGTRNIRLLTAEEEADDPVSDDAMDEEMPNERLEETWRLDKYAVEFLGAEDESPFSCHVDEILATEMLEHAQSLGARKFRLADENTREERMALWLFNPDTDITWGSLDYDTRLHEWTCDHRKGRFAMVLWQDIQQTERTPLSERYETLEYPASAVNTIRSVLAGKEDGVPGDTMKMGEWNVGYLRRT